MKAKGNYLMSLCERIDSVILAPNGIGAISRILGASIIYLLVRFLPEIFELASLYTGFSPLSKTQISRHSNVESIFFGVLCITIIVDAIYAIIRWNR